ncbi:MAG: Uma2 family endonuclease [Cyanobacteria bacterium P01_G01_bin.49]
MTTYTLNITPFGQMSDEQFYQLCCKNPNIKFERNQQGNLIIMSPTGGEIGNYNSEINADFVLWNRQTKLGIVFDSSTCFRLPSGANRSPDVAWVSKDKWNQLTPEEKSQFPPIAPDFVLELMSPSDHLKDTQEKMEEYMISGVKLGWLINPRQQTVEIYRQEIEIELLTKPNYLFGEKILPDFTLNLQFLWLGNN